MKNDYSNLFENSSDFENNMGQLLLKHPVYIATNLYINFVTVYYVLEILFSSLNEQGVTEGIFEIINRFWAHKNWSQNFYKLMKYKI